MQEQELLRRIMLNPDIMAGKPIIKGTQLPVEYILSLLAHGTREEEIFKQHAGMTHEDIQACLLFAAKSLETSFFIPLTMIGVA